mgnify:CR=1 FL=1
MENTVVKCIRAVADRLPPGLTPKLAPISTGLGESYYDTVAWRADATLSTTPRLQTRPCSPNRPATSWL